MTLEEAKKRLERYQFRRFRDIPELAGSTVLLRDKGNAGKLLEVLLGLGPGQKGLDFSDGELKTTDFTRDNNPTQCVYVHQLRPLIDDLIAGQKFLHSKLYRMTRNMLIVPVYREVKSAPGTWMYFHPLHLQLESPAQADLRDALEADFEHLCRSMEALFDRGGSLYLKVDGRFVEVRNKDAKDRWGDYHPIYSGIYSRYVSERDFAFWLKKDLLLSLKRRQGHGVVWTPVTS